MVDVRTKAEEIEPKPSPRSDGSGRKGGSSVKLLPKAKRGEGEVFYIAVADQDAKSARQIAHTAVRLPSGRSSS